MSIVIWLLTFVLVLLSVFLVLVVLMQKSKSDGGVGAALGGGMTEATFGADTGNILATLTKNCTIAFFVLSFGLYLAHIHQNSAKRSAVTLPTLAVPAATSTATPAPATEGASAVALPTTESAAPAPAATEPAK
jgi:preprotein translocase subunit SecG